MLCYHDFFILQNQNIHAHLKRTLVGYSPVAKADARVAEKEAGPMEVVALAETSYAAKAAPAVVVLNEER